MINSLNSLELDMEDLTFGEIEQVHGGMTLQQWLQEYITASEVQAPVIDIGSVD